jgi:hypothetical protein
MTALAAHPDVAGHPERLVEIDAHEGPVYFDDDDALYFTTVPRPGPDGAPSVQIKRLELSTARVSVIVEDSNVTILLVVARAVNVLG